MTKKSELREEIEFLQRRVANLDSTNQTLEAWRASWIAEFDDSKGSLQSIHGAWTQLLQMLGAEHQTDAVMKLRDLIGEAAASPTRLELTQRATTAEGAVRIHQLAIRQLEFQRDSAQKSAYDAGFEIDNIKARCGELEELLRELLRGMQGGATRSREELATAINVMLGEDL